MIDTNLHNVMVLIVLVSNGVVSNGILPTTGQVTMNTFSRGHLFFVSSGGIIRYWQPLYKSEGTAQVSIHTIKYLELYMREYENIDNTFLFYDNMV